MAGAAHIALTRLRQVEHTAHPHSGVAGVDDDDGVIRHKPGQLVTKPLRPHRRRVGKKRRPIFLPPFAADRLHFADPSLASGGAGSIGLRQHPCKRDLGITVDGRRERIIAAERFRFDIDLDRRRTDLRHRPEMRGHATGLGADETNKVGGIDDAVGAFA